MGATGWKYFAPYDVDHEKALQALRQEVFRQGKYGQSRAMAELAGEFPEELTEDLRTYLASLQQAEEERYGGEHGFDTIEELLEAAEEEGTHSILDIEYVSDQPGFAVAWPAPEEVVRETFGTTTPTRADIERAGPWALTQALDLERWQAAYVVVYADGQPSEIYFEGVSGD